MAQAKPGLPAPARRVLPGMPDRPIGPCQENLKPAIAVDRPRRNPWEPTAAAAAAERVPGPVRAARGLLPRVVNVAVGADDEGLEASVAVDSGGGIGDES